MTEGANLNFGLSISKSINKGLHKEAQTTHKGVVQTASQLGKMAQTTHEKAVQTARRLGKTASGKSLWKMIKEEAKDFFKLNKSYKEALENDRKLFRRDLQRIQKFFGGKYF